MQHKNRHFSFSLHWRLVLYSSPPSNWQCHILITIMVWSTPNRRFPIDSLVYLHQQNIHKPTTIYFNANIRPSHIYVVTNIQFWMQYSWHMLCEKKIIFIFLYGYHMLKPLSRCWFQITQISSSYQFGFLWTRSLIYSTTKHYFYFGLHYQPPGHWRLDMSIFKDRKFDDAVDCHQFCLFPFNTINTTWNQDSKLITEFTTQSLEYSETVNPIEPSESQHRVVSVQHTLTETTNVESDNPFRSQTISITINDTITKSLDHVFWSYCILDPAFPYHQPTTTNNCNPIFSRRFGILIEHNNKATFHAQTVNNCELIHSYSINIKLVSLRTNARHSSIIIEKPSIIRIPLTYVEKYH